MPGVAVGDHNISHSCCADDTKWKAMSQKELQQMVDIVVLESKKKKSSSQFALH